MGQQLDGDVGVASVSPVDRSLAKEWSGCEALDADDDRNVVGNVVSGIRENAAKHDFVPLIWCSAAYGERPDIEPKRRELALKRILGLVKSR